jgi:exopolysaccharide biosynthesis protein
VSAGVYGGICPRVENENCLGGSCKKSIIVKCKMAPIITWTTTLLATNLFYSYSSDKMIHIVEYSSNQYESYIGVSPNSKYTVEKFGHKVDALVAINGGYHGFNSPEQRGPITKLQIDNQVIVPYNNLTILAQNGLGFEHVNSILSIDSTRHAVSIGSIEDSSYIYSGPLLLKNGAKTSLEQNKWNNARNPRTVVCIRGERILFIAVDGRRYDASGMTLKELQSLLVDVGCENAINMDGGGSTTMYIKGYGVVNTPRSADGKGNYTTISRSVSSIIYLK